MKYIFREDLFTQKAPKISVPIARRMMCLNESCMDPVPLVKDSFSRILQQTSINRYCSDISSELQRELAAYCGVPMEQVLFANGADDMIYHIFVAAREDRESFAVSPAPSYFDYKTFANEVGMQVRFLDLNEDFGFDVDRYLAMANDPHCKLAILCNPNNPTGNLMKTEDVIYFIEKIKDKPILLDETYYEFSKVSFIEEIEKHPNLILIRSFSKAFSAAGLRFGYAISSHESIRELRKVQTTFHTSLLVQAFALAILQNKTLFLNHIANVIALRDDLFTWMQAQSGIEVLPSATNFLSFRVPQRHKEMSDYLLKDGIAVRDVSTHPLLKDCLRVSISCREDVEAFKTSISAFLRV